MSGTTLRSLGAVVPGALPPPTRDTNTSTHSDDISVPGQGRPLRTLSIRRHTRTALALRPCATSIVINAETVSCPCITSWTYAPVDGLQGWKTRGVGIGIGLLDWSTGTRGCVATGRTEVTLETKSIKLYWGVSHMSREARGSVGGEYDKKIRIVRSSAPRCEAVQKSPTACGET